MTSKTSIPHDSGIYKLIADLKDRVEHLESKLEEKDDEEVRENDLHENDFYETSQRIINREIMKRRFREYGMEEAADELLKISPEAVSADQHLRQLSYLRMLGGLMTWMGTQQGYEYWRDKYNELERRIKAEEEPEEYKKNRQCGKSVKIVIHKNRGEPCISCTTCRYGNQPTHKEPCFSCWMFSNWESENYARTFRTSSEKPNIQTRPKELNGPEIDAQEILVSWLKDNGYYGLLHPSGECGCYTGEVMQCPDGYRCQDGCIAASSAFTDEETLKEWYKGEPAASILEPAEPWTWICTGCGEELKDKGSVDWQWNEMGQHWRHNHSNRSVEASPVWEKYFE